MRTTLRFGFALLGFEMLASLTSSSIARAAESDLELPPPAPPPRERHHLIAGNAPGLFIGRLSLDYGYLAAPHIVPTGSVHLQATGLPARNVSDSLVGGGGELGVRVYGSARRPSGPFIGVYAVGGGYYSRATFFGLENDTWIASYGGATDVGWSFVTRSNLVFALGGGIEYRFAESEPGEEGDFARMFVMGGVHPRVLFQVGTLR